MTEIAEERRDTLGIASINPVELAAEFNISDRQAAFVMELVKNGGQRVQAYRAVYVADCDEESPNINVLAHRAFHGAKVSQAYKSLLARVNQDLSDVVISKEKVIRDLEAVKLQAFQRVDDVQNPGSMLNAAVRATELQGRELGMFAQRHKHEHEHSLVPPAELVERLRRANPVLASAIASHLGLEILEGECSERDTDEPEELIHKTSD